MIILNIIGVILLIYIFNGAVFNGLCKLDDIDTITRKDIKKAIEKRRRK